MLTTDGLLPLWQVEQGCVTPEWSITSNWKVAVLVWQTLQACIV
jgi:hypothetical protein